MNQMEVKPRTYRTPLEKDPPWEWRSFPKRLFKSMFWGFYVGAFIGTVLTFSIVAVVKLCMPGEQDVTNPEMVEKLSIQVLSLGIVGLLIGAFFAVASQWYWRQHHKTYEKNHNE